MKWVQREVRTEHEHVTRGAGLDRSTAGHGTFSRRVGEPVNVRCSAQACGESVVC